jgi:hypothetical protein
MSPRRAASTSKAAVHAGRLWLAQRGNGNDGWNALVALDLAAVIEGLARGVLTKRR